MLCCLLLRRSVHLPPLVLLHVASSELLLGHIHDGFLSGVVKKKKEGRSGHVLFERLALVWWREKKKGNFLFYFCESYINRAKHFWVVVDTKVCTDSGKWCKYSLKMKASCCLHRSVEPGATVNIFVILAGCPLRNASRDHGRVWSCPVFIAWLRGRLTSPPPTSCDGVHASHEHEDVGVLSVSLYMHLQSHWKWQAGYVWDGGSREPPPPPPPHTHPVCLWHRRSTPSALTSSLLARISLLQSGSRPRCCEHEFSGVWNPPLCGGLGGEVCVCVGGGFMWRLEQRRRVWEGHTYPIRYLYM